MDLTMGINCDKCRVKKYGLNTFLCETCLWKKSIQNRTKNRLEHKLDEFDENIY